MAMPGKVAQDEQDTTVAKATVGPREAATVVGQNEESTVYAGDRAAKAPGDTNGDKPAMGDRAGGPHSRLSTDTYNLNHIHDGENQHSSGQAARTAWDLSEGGSRKQSRASTRRSSAESGQRSSVKSDCVVHWSSMVSMASMQERDEILHRASVISYEHALERDGFWSVAGLKDTVGFVVGVCQKFSIPLVAGVTSAMIWANVDEHSYHETFHTSFGQIFSHEVTVHFIVNDIFMCFFFGLAVKEVTEALLPGGALSPWRRAINPLFATLGGVFGPIIVYAITIVVMWELNVFDNIECSEAGGDSGHRRLSGSSSGSSSLTGSSSSNHGNVACSLNVLLKGWGVPTATDISLAWMFAVLIFGTGHPAINFLLLLAILDDALGMIIIAIFYPDPSNPVEPVWLLLVLLAMVVALVMRKFHMPSWIAFIGLCGPLSWVGLLKSHVHPALALVVVVPFMPATHAIAAPEGQANLGACDLGPAVPHVKKEKKTSFSRSGSASFARESVKKIFAVDEDHAPLHAFENQVKIPVDFGMCLFGLANAGVAVDSVGGLTFAMLIALLVGKTLGITGFSLVAIRLGFALPEGLYITDLVAMSALASVGLTVALFLANEAFQSPEPQGQAKMGAVLSVGSSLFAWLIRKVFRGSKAEECFDVDDETAPKGAADGI